MNDFNGNYKYVKISKNLPQFILLIKVESRKRCKCEYLFIWINFIEI